MRAPPRFLIVDDDVEYRRALRQHVEAEWPDAVIEELGPAGVAHLPDGDALASFDLVLLGHPFGAERGFECLRALRRTAGCPPVILFARQSDEFFAVDALKAGAANFFPKSRVSHRRLVAAIRAELGDEENGLPAPALQRTGVPPKHRLVAKLYSGDLSSVYLVEPADGGPRIAYKVVRQVPDAGAGKAFDRFLHEYEVIAKLTHPNVVRISELGVADDHAFIAMEFLDAGSLADRLAQPLEPARALRYTRQIASALEAIHKAGILHRDLKPANVMFRSDGSLALIDFGLAKQVRLEAGLTGRGEIFGTPHYMSPEQGHAQPTDARSDIYSLGCMLYEMLTGERPFTAPSPMAVIYKHGNAPRPRLPAALAHLQPVLDRMLAVDPADRYQSAAALLADLPA